jgi:hypothetical protein
MIRTFAFAGAILLGSCASVDTSSYRQSVTSAAEGLTPQDVSTGFAIAVVDGCAAAAEAGKTLEQLGNSKIVRETTPDPLRRPKPGSTLWAPIPGQGIVSIEQEQGGACDVSAYGPRVEPTFNAVVAALQARGYVSQPLPAAAFRSFEHDLKLTANGRTVRVMLIGNEPGAPGKISRFSILSAFVTVTTP